ncbi:MAG: 50S ribosomal protein L9 [Alphaproteobacteria bacterium]|nr:50S ribosomal protein L9 [Alphaproteobacteria bacterium]
MATQVILLERIEKLGDMGETVRVKPGYARNYLIPQRKALRATPENRAYFETQEKHLKAENEKRRKEAEKQATKLKGLKVPLIRQASEGGQLYGSVTARDIAQEVSTLSGEQVTRAMIQIHQNFKTIGLFSVEVALHPEVKVEVVVNIARTLDEAETQANTGRALITDNRGELVGQDSDEEQLESVLEDSALEARKEKQEADAAKAEEEQAKEEARALKKAEKEAAKAASAEEDEAESEEAADEEAKDA